MTDTLPPSTEQRLLLAEIGPAHGVKGYVKLRYYGEDVSDLSKYNPLFTAKSGDQTLTLHIKNATKGGYIAAIEGISDRNAGESLKGTKLYVPRDRLDMPEENEYYHADLIGCKAYENGTEIGTIIAVDNFGAGDLLEIKPPVGDTFYLPFKNEFVGKVDLASKTIEVTVPEGLRD